MAAYAAIYSILFKNHQYIRQIFHRRVTNTGIFISESAAASVYISAPRPRVSESCNDDCISPHTYSALYALRLLPL